jgi:hypothetical protein
MAFRRNPRTGTYDLVVPATHQKSKRKPVSPRVQQRSVPSISVRTSEELSAPQEKETWELGLLQLGLLRPEFIHLDDASLVEQEVVELVSVVQEPEEFVGPPEPPPPVVSVHASRESRKKKRRQKK